MRVAHATRMALFMSAPATGKDLDVELPGRSVRSLSAANAAMILAVGLVFITTNILTPTIVGVYVDSYGLSMESAGYSAAVYMLGGGLGAGIVSYFVRRARTSALLTAAAVMLAAANLASTVTTSVEEILFIRLVAGIGEGAGLALMAAGTVRLKDPSRYYAVFGIALMILSAGIQYSIPWFRALFGPRMLFVPIAVMPACLLLFITAFPDLRAHPRDVLERAPQARLSNNSSYFWMGILATFSIYTAYGAAFAYIERIGVSAGLSVDAVAYVIGWGYFIAALGSIAAFVTSHWRGRAVRISAALVIVTVATAVTVARTPTAYVTGLIAFFCVWYYFAPNLLALMSLADPSGRLAAAVMGSLEVGIAVGPAIAAPHIDGGNFRVIAIMGACGYLLGMVLLIPVLRRVGSSHRAPHALGAKTDAPVF